ncbi:hypothetical protein EG328_008814 [Venturia inaequalis]|uniref:Uncharacterized protein n=1 Tax=Venturia inaequalis TaxID=5025 RepID=A0A8H3YMU0_VENIN|nr:hypothetical protein EG328_008814 [Venturia inaequalis]
MKIYTAFYQLLPLVSLSHGYDFASAQDLNLCGHLYNGGSGFGTVRVITYNARCYNDGKFIKLRCLITRPVARGEIPGTWECLEHQTCIPHERGPEVHHQDAGCITLFSPMGEKGDADVDNHACSAGMTIGNDPIWILSSISADQPNNQPGIVGCTITQSGTHRNIYSKNPCPKQSSLIRLAAHTTYQACITTALAFAKKSVAFTWHVSGPGMTRRGLDDGKPFSEMFTIVNGTANAKDAVQIVIGD